MQKDKVWPLIGSTHSIEGLSVKELVAAKQVSVEATGVKEHTPPRALQFFNGHENSYYRKKLSDADAQYLVNYMNETGVRAFAHCPFCINLSKDPLDHDKSLKAVHGDISALGKAGISSVCHIGHHLNKFSMTSVCRTLSCLDFWGVPGTYPLLLENAAGDGTELGVSWDELTYLAQNTDPHIGFCIDTQHAFAGLKPDLATVDGVNEFLKNIDRSVGLNRVKLFHLNDSKWNPDAPKGKKDSHANIGSGYIWGVDDKAKLGLNHLLLRGAELGISFITETPPRLDGPDDPVLVYNMMRQMNQ